MLTSLGKLLSKSSSKVSEKRIFNFSEELEKPPLMTETKEDNGIHVVNPFQNLNKYNLLVVS